MIERTDRAGLTTLYARRADGPTAAGISFRVGIADETLPQRGITHLVEHLALHRVGLSDYHSNGSTGATVTTFHVVGDDDRVRDFLDLVCRSLGDLPLDRLEVERSVIKTEAAGRAAPSDLGLWRHGPRGYGLTSYPEWGVEFLGPDQVAAWAASRFTRQNAVLWVSGPRDLDLDLVLPHGHRAELPELTNVLPALPACYSSGRRSVSFEGLVRRSSAATLFAALLEKQLYQGLRVDTGLSYQVNVGYDGFTADLAGVAGFADVLQDKEGAVVGQLIDTLAAVRAGRWDDQTLQPIRRRAAEAMSSDDLDARRLPGVAFDALIGGRILSSDQLRDELATVTDDDVRAAGEEVFSSMLLRVPDGQSADWGGFAPAPVSSDHTHHGTAYPSLDDQRPTLVVGEHGLTASWPAGPASVRFDDLAGVLAWPDGGVTLIGNDAIMVAVEPTIHRLPGGMMDWLASRIPPELIVRRPPRDADEIPAPTVVEPDGSSGQPGRPWRRRRRRD